MLGRGRATEGQTAAYPCPPFTTQLFSLACRPSLPLLLAPHGTSELPLYPVCFPSLFSFSPPILILSCLVLFSCSPLLPPFPASPVGSRGTPKPPLCPVHLSLPISISQMQFTTKIFHLPPRNNFFFSCLSEIQTYTNISCIFTNDLEVMLP